MLTSYIYISGAIPVEQQKYIVLDDKNISGSGSSDELSTLCTSITDLHIPKNLIKDWDPVSILINVTQLLSVILITLQLYRVMFILFLDMYYFSIDAFSATFESGKE